MTAPHSTVTPDVIQGTEGTGDTERQWQVWELKPDLPLIISQPGETMFFFLHILSQASFNGKECFCQKQSQTKPKPT